MSLPPPPPPRFPIWYDASSSQSYPQHFVTFLLKAESI